MTFLPRAGIILLVTSPEDAHAAPPDIHSEIRRAIAVAVYVLAPDIVRIRYTAGTDHDGDPAIHFRIVVSDQYATRANMLWYARRVEIIIERELDTHGRFGMRAFFRYRTLAEQNRLRCAEWE